MIVTAVPETQDARRRTDARVSLVAGLLVGLWPGAILVAGPAVFRGWVPMVIGIVLGVAGARPLAWLGAAVVGLALAFGAQLALLGWEPRYLAYAAVLSLPFLGSAFVGLVARQLQKVI